MSGDMSAPIWEWKKVRLDVMNLILSGIRNALCI